MFGQDAWGNFVDLADELEHRVIREMLEGELALRNIARICLAKDCMSIAWNDLARFQC